MTDCKNCKYTDEYCASGDCTAQSPRSGSQKGDLTSQWKQKKLPLGWYFVKDEDGKIDYAEYLEWFNADGWCGNYFECEEMIVEVLAEAPDYIDWQNMVNCACEEHKANTKLLEENAELKEQVERLEKQLNKQGEQVLTMIDLLLKSYFYLSAARDCKLTLEHCGNIGILCDLINKCFKDLGK